MPDVQPYRNFNFHVEIDGIAEAAFAEAVVPSMSIDVVEYREGADKTSVVRKLPGRASFGNVVLRRGITGDLSLYQWFRAVLEGEFQPRTVSIVLLDAQRQPVRRWVLRDAWPTKYDSSDLKAKGNEVVIETVELACGGIEIES